MPPKKTVYIFGAGATIAEAFFAGIDQRLTLRDISESVIQKAKSEPSLKDILSDVAVDDIVDIELYISLLESLHIQRFSDIASRLRFLFCRSIQDKLSERGAPLEPILTMALLQMHEKIDQNEKLVGVISLNYDNLLDRAFNNVFGAVNYGIKCRCETADYNISEDCIPLIKLHGSFNWRRSFPLTLIDEGQARSGEQAEMLWIPPSIQKEREPYPFNILWGRAFEMLDCDILRIIGCRLSQNDLGLISLLFSTQLKSGEAYRIELINTQKAGEDIRERNGFLRNVRVLGELEGCQDFVDYEPSNVFETWLKQKLSSFRESGIPIDELGLTYVNAVLGVKSK